MKKIISVCLMGLCAFYVVSCNQNDEEELLDLGILSNTHLTRTNMEDGSICQNENDIIRYNMQYPKEENGCAFTLMMERWISSKDPSYFGSNCPENATEHYYNLKAQFQQQYPDWNMGDSITRSQIMGFSGSGFSRDTIFSQGTTCSSYFSVSSNRKNACGAYFRNSANGAGHVAYGSFLTGCFAFKGENFCNSLNNKFYFNQSNNGWIMIGVIYK